MLERLPGPRGLGAVIVLCLWGLGAPAAQAPLGLHELLSIGRSAQSASLRWGATRREIQQRYPELIEHPAFLGFRLQARISAQGCTFVVYLSGNRKSDRLEQVWIEYRKGALADCKAHLEGLLRSLYGLPSTSEIPATQDSGAVTESDWRTPSSCVTLRWEEQGAEHGVSPLNVKLADLKTGCGRDPEVPAGPRQK
jgi:hypothetical protein